MVMATHNVYYLMPLKCTLLLLLILWWKVKFISDAGNGAREWGRWGGRADSCPRADSLP